MKRFLLSSVLLLSLNAYSVPKQPFDAWDTFTPTPTIHTKIVNKSFRLFMNIGTLAEYRLYDMNNDANLTPWKRFDARYIL